MIEIEKTYSVFSQDLCETGLLQCLKRVQAMTRSFGYHNFSGTVSFECLYGASDD